MLLHAGIIICLCGQPTLEPTSLYVCPNETAIFTCQDRQIELMTWKVESHIEERPIECLIGLIEEDVELPIKCFDSDDVCAVLTNIANRSEDYLLADMTVNLTLHNIRSKSAKISKVTCTTDTTASASLILAGMK